MIIGINLLPYLPGQQGGAEVYLRSILFEIQKMNFSNDCNVKFLLFISEESLGKYISKNNPNFKEVIVLRKGNRLKRILYEQLVLPFYVKKYKVDVLVSNYVAPILAPTKNVVIIHDMLYKRMPELFEKAKLLYWQFIIPLLIKTAWKIGTVSNFSKDEIINFFPQSKSKIFVTVEGVKEEFIIHSRSNETIKKEDFLFTVVSFGKHKNLVRLIEAISILSKKNINVFLKVVGSAKTPDAKEEFTKVQEIIKKENIEKCIEFLGGVNDHQLSLLYKKAKVFVFPSLYEGFGLPILEAQAFGTPIVSSTYGSLKEIGGNGCLYFDPLSSNDIAEKIEVILKDSDMRNNLIQNGYVNAEKYNWKLAAKQLIKEIIVK